MNYTDIVKQYSNAGLFCIPTKKDKSPLLPKGWKDGFTIEEFTDSYGLGLICGKMSGGLECLDFDNHQMDAKENLTVFLSIPEVKAIYQKHKLPVEKSMNGGYHLLFRCSKNEGNRKLASRMFDGKPDCFIETRGEGGYFCSYPTPGYSVARNDIFTIPAISELERAVLFDNAISLNEFCPPIKTEYESTDRPGDLYNASFDSGTEMRSILTNAGWRDVGNNRWRRPGKSEGISATLGKVAPNIFYVFTANAFPFEPMKPYTAFQVLGLIKFGGDFKQAAASLPKPDKITVTTKGIIQPGELEDILRRSKIDTRVKIEQPPTILSLVEPGPMRFEYKRMFTLGNFSVIIGKAKSKKTFLSTMFAASLLSDSRFNPSFYPQLQNIGKQGVMWFDTEQGEFDSYNTMKRIERMSGDIENLSAFSLRPYTPMERCQLIEQAFKLWGDKTAYCVIDGIADLANGINDEDEATRVSSMLLRLTKVHNCHITTIIHQNKNDNYATGHLGSSVMKKAEIVISVAKNKDVKSMADVFCDLSRGQDFESFSFDIQDGLPKVCEMVKKPTKASYDYDKEQVLQTEEAPF